MIDLFVSIQRCLQSTRKATLGVSTEAYQFQVAVESKRAKPMPYADDGGCTHVALQIYHFLLLNLPSLFAELCERHFSEIYRPKPVTRKSQQWCVNRSRASGQSLNATFENRTSARVQFECLPCKKDQAGRTKSCSLATMQSASARLVGETISYH